MTTRRGEASLRVDANTNPAFRALNRLQDHARGISRRIDNSTGGVLGRATRGAVRGGRGAAGIIGAGAGLQAGAAIFEQVFERLFELFEDTPLLETFTDALQDGLQAIAPLAGVIIKSLTPAVKALTPVLEPLARALAPLAELIGGALTVAILALNPILLPMINLIEQIARSLRDTVFYLLEQAIGALNRIPGLNIQTPNFVSDSFDEAGRQVREATAAREAEESGRGSRGDTVIENRVVIDSVTIDQVFRKRVRRAELGR